MQGFIGGAVLDAVHNSHPNYHYTLLVRNEERGKAVKAKYPNVKFAHGTLDDASVVEKAAAEADIVIRESPYNSTKLP